MAENPVNSERARHLLADCKECKACNGNGCKACGHTGWTGKPWGRSRMSAIKKRMEEVSGEKVGRLIFLSKVRDFLRDNPGFKESDVYHRKRLSRMNPIAMK